MKKTNIICDCKEKEIVRLVLNNITLIVLSNHDKTWSFLVFFIIANNIKFWWTKNSYYYMIKTKDNLLRYTLSNSSQDFLVTYTLSKHYKIYLNIITVN